MDNNVLKFDLTPRQIKFKSILNKEFVELEIYAISNADPNRNGSHFVVDGMKKAVDGGDFKNKPIVGYFERGDFTTHEGVVGYDQELDKAYWDTSKGERILGWIRESDSVELVERDGLMWIRCTCALCVKYCYQQVKRLLKDRKKKVSVEITVNERLQRPDGIEDIIGWTLNGITILGSKHGKPVEEGIEGAHLSILERLSGDEFNEQKKVVSFAYDHMDGGAENKVDEKGVSAMDTYSITVNKSKDAVSTTPWADVDKFELCQYGIKADNYKDVAPDMFLSLKEGWEDGVEGSLRYPVMCVENDVVVYNKEALDVAMAYAKKNNDDEMVQKITEIYQQLDLEVGEVECNDELYCGLYGDEPAPAGDNNPVNEGDPASSLQMGEGEGNGSQPTQCACGEGNEPDPNDNQCKMSELEQKVCSLEESCKAYEATIEEQKAKIAEVESAYAEFQAAADASAQTAAETIKKLNEDIANFQKRAEEAEAAAHGFVVEKLKSFAVSIMANEKIAKEDYDRIVADCDGKYTTEEEIKRDVAYAIFNSRPAKQEQFGVPIVTTPKLNEGESNKSYMTREERIAARCHK